MPAEKRLRVFRWTGRHRRAPARQADRLPRWSGQRPAGRLVPSRRADRLPRWSRRHRAGRRVPEGLRLGRSVGRTRPEPAGCRAPARCGEWASRPARARSRFGAAALVSPPRDAGRAALHPPACRSPLPTWLARWGTPSPSPPPPSAPLLAAAACRVASAGPGRPCRAGRRPAGCLPAATGAGLDRPHREGPASAPSAPAARGRSPGRRDQLPRACSKCSCSLPGRRADEEVHAAAI